MNIIDELMNFGLSRQESNIYIALLTYGAMSGYEVAKETGISRSNVYASLQSMVEKGACVISEEESTKYVPISIEDFLDDTLLDLKNRADFIKKHAPKKIEVSQGYLTITGTKNIANRIFKMLRECSMRLYVMASSRILIDFKKELVSLIESGKKVVILSDDFDLEGAVTYKTNVDDNQIRLITDSNYVLTGIYSSLNFCDEHEACLYSDQQNLVDVMKEALKNKIILLENVNSSLDN